MLAASAFFAIALAGLDQTKPVTRVAVPMALDTPASVNILADGRAVGRAYLLDAEGYFVSPRVPDGVSQITGRDKAEMSFTLVSTDRLSGLSLLKSSTPWTGARSVITAPTERQDGMVFRGFVVSPTETRQVMAEVVGRLRGAVLTSANRLVPVNEIRYEQAGVPSSLIFLRGSELHGPLASVLAESVMPTELSQSNSAVPQADSTRIQIDQSLLPFNRSAKASDLGFTNQRLQNYGPGVLIVGHLLGTDIVRRVVEGFRSPQRRVVYPYVGLVCRTALSEGRGAEVVEVAAKSPAERAGLRPGDVVRQVGKFAIRNQYDYSAVTWKFSPGETVVVGFDRRQNRQTVEVSLGGISY